MADPDNTDIELALLAVGDALDALLVALVALGGVEEVETPTFALDRALGSDERYQAARRVFRDVHADVGEVLGDEHRKLFYKIEEATNAIAVASTDVGFLLGLSAGRKLR